MENSSNEKQLAFALLAAGEQVRRTFDQNLAHMGITFSEYQLLSSLSLARGKSATRVVLAEEIRRTPSGVTRALKPLEKLNYVETTKDARDARRSLATLTPEGETMVSNAAELIDDLIADMNKIVSLSTDDQAVVLSLCEGLTA